MSKHLKSLLVVALAAICACSTKEQTLEESKAAKELENYKQVRAILNQVHAELQEQHPEKAKMLLVPLQGRSFEETGVPSLANEVNALNLAIEKTMELPNRDGVISSTENRMMDETKKKLMLPENYEETIQDSVELLPMEMPESETEMKLRQKCVLKKFSCQGAGIAEIAAEIKRSSGINVIADDSIMLDKTLTLEVENVPLVEVLRYITRNMKLAFYMGENMLWITKADDEESQKKNLETRIIRLHHGTIPIVPDGPSVKGAEDSPGTIENKEDNELEEALDLLLKNSNIPDASYKLFRDRNIVVIRNTRENIRLAEKIVKEFDKPPYQVSIEARFITISRDDLLDVGTEITQKNAVDYNDPSDPEAIKMVNALTELGTLKSGAESGVGLVNFSGVIANRTFDVLISALDKKESTITLSVPKVTVMNNRQARIRKGDKLYYFEEYEVESIDRGDYGTDQRLVPSGTPVELPIGLTFDVKVNVGNDGKTILLGLKPEIVELKKWEDYLTTGSDDDDDDDDSSSSSDDADDDDELTSVKLPHTYEQSILTTVGVASGQTVVMGGMLENKKILTVQKVPILGDIPLLGFFFKHKVVKYTPMNLLCFITATVINDEGKYVEKVELQQQK